MSDLSKILETYRTCKDIIYFNRKVNEIGIKGILEIIEKLRELRLDSSTKRSIESTCIKAIAILYKNNLITIEDLSKIGINKTDIETLLLAIDLENTLSRQTLDRDLLEKIEIALRKLEGCSSEIICNEVREVLRKIITNIVNKLLDNNVHILLRCIRSSLYGDEDIAVRNLKVKSIIDYMEHMFRDICEEYSTQLYDHAKIVKIKIFNRKYAIAILWSYNLDIIKEIYRYNDKKRITNILLLIDIDPRNLPITGARLVDCIYIINSKDLSRLTDCSDSIILLLDSVVRKFRDPDTFDSIKRHIIRLIIEKGEKPISRRMICYLSSKDVEEKLKKLGHSINYTDIIIIFYELARDGYGEIRLIEDDLYLIVRRLPNE